MSTRVKHITGYVAEEVDINNVLQWTPFFGSEDIVVEVPYMIYKDRDTCMKIHGSAKPIYLSVSE